MKFEVLTVVNTEITSSGMQCHGVWKYQVYPPDHTASHPNHTPEDDSFNSYNKKVYSRSK
jgi:hypothetical protein